MKYINFSQKEKQLHQEMCQAISDMMTEKNVTKLDLLGTDASHAFILIQNKFSDDIQWVEVEKVILKDGCVLITSVDDGYTDNTIDIARNMYVVSCSIRDLYETVYEELSKVNI